MTGCVPIPPLNHVIFYSSSQKCYVFTILALALTLTFMNWHWYWYLDHSIIPLQINNETVVLGGTTGYSENTVLQYSGLIQDGNVTLPLPHWFEGGFDACQLPPSGYLMGDQDIPKRHVGIKRTRQKIAFLLMEYDAITFSDVWSQYFRDAESSQYVLFIHLQNILIPETMGYREIKMFYPNLFSLPESMIGIEHNIKMLKTNIASYWGHLMPILLSFWEHAIEDDSVTGVIPLSGACLPVKSFAQLYETLVLKRTNKFAKRSILNFANEERKRHLCGDILRGTLYRKWLSLKVEFYPIKNSALELLQRSIVLHK